MADTVRKVDSERLTQILPDALRAIHEVIESHKVTKRRMAVLDFLTEVGKQDEFILLSDVTKTSVLVDAISHQDESGVTPSDVEGPLYREDPPWREKPVKIYEEYEGAQNGDVLFVRGRVHPRTVPRWTARSSTSGRRARMAATTFGTRQPDYNFRGRFGVDEDGGYEFQTMVPKPYTIPTDGPVGRLLDATGQHPWRPAHIHFQGGGEWTPAARHAGLLPTHTWRTTP